MFHPHLLILLIGTCLAEDKWVWSRNNHGVNDRRDRIMLDQSQYDNFITYENNRIREYQRQRDREYERERDREQTTRPPPYYNRPVQQNNNEEYDDYDTTSQEDQNKYGPNRYGQKYPNGIYPYAGGGGGGYGGLQHLIPNPDNGILVGPDGGIIGRPTGFIQQLAHPGIGGDGGLLNYLRPNPGNGILIGPGGPNGIIGRPPPLNGQFPLGPGGIGIGGGVPQLYPGINAPPPQGLGSTGPQLFPGVGAQPQGNGPVGPQVFPGVNNGQVPQRPPPPRPIGPLFQPNPNFIVGGGGVGRPGRGDIYPYVGYPYGYPGGIGGGLYPGGYGVYSGQRHDNGYGFYPSQYYPNMGGHHIPYNNNDIAGDIGYAPGYYFGFEGKSNSKKNDNNKSTNEKGDKNIIKKSVNDKLLKF